MWRKGSVVVLCVSPMSVLSYVCCVRFVQSGFMRFKVEAQ